MVCNLGEIMQIKNSTSLEKEKNSIKEVMQEIVLLGLSKAGFFEKAAFYGGTALRIFYGLDRFSEDLDFSLVEKDPNFDLASYIPTLKSIVSKYGLNVNIEIKEKKEDSNIKSAFLKANTIEHLLIFFPTENANKINKNDLIKIKFEVDINPPALATFESKFHLYPEPFKVILYDKESLFSGKLHAVICRTWKNRTKGRDLYDYIFYLQKGIKFNLKHLRERLVESKYIDKNEELTLDKVKEMLCSRFDTIDYEKAKEDVIPFIDDKSSLDIWSSEFFKSITSNLECI